MCTRVPTTSAGPKSSATPRAQVILIIVPEHGCQHDYKIGFKTGLGRLLEAHCHRVHRKVALERSSKPSKYELQGPYGDLVYELLGTTERNNYSQGFAPAAGPLDIQCWIADLPNYMSEVTLFLDTIFLGHVRIRHFRAWAADALAVTILELLAAVGKV